LAGGIARAHRREPPTETATITATTLVLLGDRDGFLPRRDQEDLVAAIPGASLVVYEGSGHSLAVEDPERLGADVARFAGRVASPAG
jgi:non-heme chloroperoxidase